MTDSIRKDGPLGYLYFIVRNEDLRVPDDAIIFIKVGMTKDPRSRISNYITHHIGEAPPIYYKIWQVRNEKAEETLALAHFDDKRVIKTGSTCKSEVIRATKAQIEAYSPRDPQKRAIAPHTMLPAEIYIAKQDAAQRFEEHWEELREIQERVILNITNFLRAKRTDNNRALACKLRAPCGTGKTHMTCEAIRQVAADDATLKVCILCPTKLIAEQWRGNFYRLGIQAPILTKSDLQTKNGEQREDQTGHRFRIITYASCPGIRADPSWTYIFDEAHHTTGSVDGDAGITKRLTNETAAIGCRRLFLTFTPKNSSREGANSMDDPELYGTDIEFPSMRDLVEAGLMPDYRLTMTYQEQGETLESIHEDQIPNSKKVLVCLQNLEHIEAAREFLISFVSENSVFVAHSGMPNEAVAESIEAFGNELGRSWLLTCLVLLEGADIPIADTVVLLASWKTEARLVQLLLRPGRWYPKKPTFNIVVPSDDNHLVENNLRVAGFDVMPAKVRHFRRGAVEVRHRTPREIVSASGHVWAISYTDKNSAGEGLTPAASDFDSAISSSQISAAQIGLDKAVPGDMVILRGPSKVAFACVSGARTVLETTTDGKNRKRTILDVVFLPVRWEPKPPEGVAPVALAARQESSIVITVKDYRSCICEMWNGREDKDWICNPRFTGNFKYDTERRALIARMLDNRIQ